MKLEHRMNRFYGEFNENDKYIADCILTHKKDCARLTIHDFAKKYHLSQSSLTRFAQKIELEGYSELKSRVRMEELDQGKLDFSFRGEVMSNYKKMVESIRNRDCESLFQALDRAERILIFASGYSQARVASEFKRIFLPLGKKIYYMHGHDMAEAFGELAEKGDLVILISLSGESEHVVSLAERLRLRQIPLVSITRMQVNRLARICGENLYIRSLELPEEYHVRYEVTTPYFILIELLYIRYQNYLNSGQT